MGLSENSVPLHPMVNDHYPYQMAIIGGIPHFQTYPYDYVVEKFRGRIFNSFSRSMGSYGIIEHPMIRWLKGHCMVALRVG